MSGRIAVMAKEPIEAGPTSKRVAANITDLRGRLQQRDISARLAALGRPLAVSTLSKIEQGDRRIDVDDLVALAIALGATPNRLLLPGDVGDQDSDPVVELAAGISATPLAAWRWASGDLPLPPQPWEPSRAPSARTQDFRERNRPHDPDRFDFDELAPLRADLGPVWEALKSAAIKAGVPTETAIRFMQFMQAWDSIPTAGGDS